MSTVATPTATEKAGATRPHGQVALSISDAALRPLRAIEKDLRALSERYRDVAFETCTSAGLAAAKAARLDLRENGRYAVQRATEAFKAEANAAKRAVEAEADRLIGITKPREDEIDALVKAREEELAAEKAERERIEAQRIAGHRARIDKLRSYIAQAAGKTSEQIGKAAQAVADLSITRDLCEEFEAETLLVRAEVFSSLEVLRDEAKAREDAAARVEAQRIENERAAAELAAERKRIADESAALQRQRDALAAEARAKEEAIAKAEAIAKQRLEDEARAAGAMAAPQQPAPAEPAAESAAAAVPPATQAQAEPADPPTLTIGAINARLHGPLLNADFLGRLGFHATQVKAARLFHERDWPAIKDALVDHIRALP